MAPIYTAKTFDASSIHFGPVEKNKMGGKFIPLTNDQGAKTRVTLQFPTLHLPFGLSGYREKPEDEPVSYSADLSFRGIDENQTVKYPAGQVTLDPAAFEEFLTFSGYREPEANRVLRSQLAWEVLLTQLGATSSDSSATTVEGLAPSVPDLGESAGTGEPPFSEVVAALLTGEVRLDGLPLLRLPLNNAQRVVLFRIDQDAMPKWVPQVVPFPTSAFPGQRANVRLLRGTSDKGVLRTVSPKVVEAGGEVTAVGNADSFDVATSQVRYQNPDAKDAARATCRSDPTCRPDTLTL